MYCKSSQPRVRNVSYSIKVTGEMSQTLVILCDDYLALPVAFEGHVEHGKTKNRCIINGYFKSMWEFDMGIVYFFNIINHYLTYIAYLITRLITYLTLRRAYNMGAAQLTVRLFLPIQCFFITTLYCFSSEAIFDILIDL